MTRLEQALAQLDESIGRRLWDELKHPRRRGQFRESAGPGLKPLPARDDKWHRDRLSVPGFKEAARQGRPWQPLNPTPATVLYTATGRWLGPDPTTRAGAKALGIRRERPAAKSLLHAALEGLDESLRHPWDELRHPRRRGKFRQSATHGYEHLGPPTTAPDTRASLRPDLRAKREHDARELKRAREDPNYFGYSEGTAAPRSAVRPDLTAKREHLRRARHDPDYTGYEHLGPAASAPDTREQIRRGYAARRPDATGYEHLGPAAAAPDTRSELRPDLTGIRSKRDHFTIRDGKVVPASEGTPLEHLYRTRAHAERALGKRRK